VRTEDLIGQGILVLKSPRPQGFQFVLNQIRSWQAGIFLKLERDEIPEDRDLAVLRILCPEEFQNLLLRHEHLENLKTFVSFSDPKWEDISKMTWRDSEHLLTLFETIRDNWYSGFSQTR